jgi:hypothetical protein
MQNAAWALLTAFICSSGMTHEVLLHSTDRLPGASGTARVECKGGTTTIELELNSIRPASLFGGDYNTYVLWVVPPRGPAENAGEVTVDGSHGSLKASTSAREFAILVTAEPHYLASVPSAFVVFQNEQESDARIIKQPLVQGVYNFHRSTLDRVKGARGKVHTEIRQAMTAVRLAQRADAASFAGEEFAEAQRALHATLNLWQTEKNRTEIAGQARETVRLAVAAQRLAEDRAREGTQRVSESSGGGRGEFQGRELRGQKSLGGRNP